MTARADAAHAKAGRLAQTRKMRRTFAETAKARELRKLAGRAGTSEAEAARMRDAGHVWCPVHGWVLGIRCEECRRQQRAAESALRKAKQ